MASKYKFNFTEVNEKLKNEGKGGFEKDKRFWEQEKKKENTVIIRFIPDQTGMPYVKVYSHSFKYDQGGKTKWYIENCANTFGYDRECPICAKNQIYYNSAFKQDKAIASERGRKLAYISNIQIINNPMKPEENGKVYLWKYGKKIFEKMQSRVFPTEADLQDPEFIQFTPYDLFEGANFVVKTVMQGESADKMFPNYDQSRFMGQSALTKTDEELDAIMDKTSLLSEFIDEAKFPTNEKVLSILGGLLGQNGFEEEAENPSSNSLFENEEPDTTPEPEPAPAPAPAKKAADKPKAADKKADPAPVPEAAPAAEPTGSEDPEEDDFFAEFVDK